MKNKTQHLYTAGPMEWMAYNRKTKKMSTLSFDEEFLPWYVDEDVDLLQYTGYADRDGAKIYGGDLLTVSNEKPPHKEMVRKVVFYKGVWFMYSNGTNEPIYLSLHRYANLFKKIGNCLTHPEVWTD